MVTQPSQHRTSPIRASELGQYAYCAKAWWLGRVEGVQPSNVRQLEAGTAVHAQHGDQVALAGWLARLALICLALGALFAAIWLVMEVL